MVADHLLFIGRPLACPVTAWLRIPLSWYHSTTYSLFPDETHQSIKRSFYSPSAHASLPPTRRQFCGYCGTHLTAWNEVSLGTTNRTSVQSTESAADYLDVTLGSLLSDSLQRLEALHILPDSEDDEGEGEEEHRSTAAQDITSAPDYAAKGGLVKSGAAINNESHVLSSGDADVTSPPVVRSLHRMSGRGVPFFEEMVENSRLGRIKRQKGQYALDNGLTTVQWEVVEIGEDDDDDTMADSTGSVAGIKRARQDS